MTLEQIVEETRHLPREQVAELVDHLTLSLHQSMDPAVEAAWKAEASRRMEEIRSGRVVGIPGNMVSAPIRQLVGR